eukprot:TRINITY_DN13745_c0_g1_i1.p1 TRINITY_DN13745_c0_g1~~TRINITY_DN13745_c0_g1_i1.p1  ORF type:complete len:2600 (-),score=438.75 TRINITY_DN13745_c0_g1_i1:20-7819(-)
MAYINGRYVAKGKLKGKGKGRGDRGDGGFLDDDERFQRKPGDEDVALERKYNIDILQPGETRVGYLFNLKPTRYYDDGGRNLSGFLLYFLQRDGTTMRCTFVYRPYFFIQIDDRANIEQMRDVIQQRYAHEGCIAQNVEKEDLAMEDHIVGRQRRFIKVSLENNEGLNRVRRDIQSEMKRNGKGNLGGVCFDLSEMKNPMARDEDTGKTASLMDNIEEIYEYDVPYMCRVMIDNGINCGKWFQVTRNKLALSVDNVWDTMCTVTCLKDMLVKPGLRIFAWDIECTKQPLKFPDSAYDRITMISVMVDGSGFLIVNRSEVAEDIEPLEYTPKPQFQGVFETYNEPDEAALLRRFFTLTLETSPHIIVSFNGDSFDFPFVTNRAKAYNIDWQAESGIEKANGEEYFAGKWMVHLDCFAWVQRDSYLPCGARGLKAVTRYKLKYDPVELDPEDMTPFAKERPQELAAYSVSDAVATYYLYMKYIHDFIFALCSIIPYGPDDVLRRGSGTLCESLLMGQAFHANVVFPNKHVDDPLEFHKETNRLIEQSTYEGARVECMRVGVFRADIKETFQLEPSAFQVLLNDLKPTVDFFLIVEEKVKLEDVANYEEILASIEKTLRDLCDPAKVAAQIGRRVTAAESQGSPGKKAPPSEDDYNLKLVEYEVVQGSGGVKSGGKRVKRATERVIKDDFPMIYHLDVGAMYPNIILSNRLQPSAIVDPEFCAACSYNDPANNCQRKMEWKWRGELYKAKRADVKAIVQEMENEGRKYNQKDRDTSEIKRVGWRDLRDAEKVEEIRKAVRIFSQKAYSRVKSSVYEDRRDIVCQRENPFYVNTVLDFRDRRYTYKRAVKTWAGKLEKAEEAGDIVATQEAQDMVLLYDSLQLAHKCILNSFYGYVMRKGARWHSMRMAGIVTYTGSNLIREAREFCEMVGLPLELDTDGIWCLLPKSFPDVFKFKLKNGKEIKMPYPNCVLNYRVHEKYTNHQYQTRLETGEWEARSENSIFFEIDGPYKAMIIPSSTEEDRMLKKRYAVFNFDGSIAELKGFEIKRRGELKLIQVFQEEFFPEVLKGSTKEEVFQIIGQSANRWLDVIESKGRTMTDDEVLYFFSENKSMSKSVEASGNFRSVQITCAKRLAAFLGVDSFLTDSGISCQMLISKLPPGRSTTERAVPVKIFTAEYEVKKQWLRTWLEDASLNDFDMRSIIDWDYYKDRLIAVFQKLISIPAAYSKIANPCPRVRVPDWLRKRVAEQNDRFQQRSLALYLKKSTPGGIDALEAGKRKLCDLEDLVGEAGGGGYARAKGSNGPEIPLVEFGKGPKRWLEAQRLRWAANGRGREMATSGSGGVGSGFGRASGSLFDNGARAWATLSVETLRSTWHVVSVEPAQFARNSGLLRVGDAVMARIDDEDDDMGLASSSGGQGNEPRKGRVVGFVGGLVRVSFDDVGSSQTGEEALLKRGAVTPLKEEGLFVCWAATEPGLTFHKFEINAKRRVVLALGSDFSPEDARRPVRPNELEVGLRVWLRDNSRAGPGVVRTAAPEVGLCGVTWSDDTTEVTFSDALERQCGSVHRVTRDPPRNMKHPCLVELELGEAEYQQQRSEGALGDRDSGWPRVDAIYEGEVPLDFDFISRLGSTIKLAAPEKAEDPQGVRGNKFTVDDFKVVSSPELRYLSSMSSSKNVYVHLCFDLARPSCTFCGIFSPTLNEAWASFGGLNAAEGESMRTSLEAMLGEQLSMVQSSASGGLPSAVRAEVFFESFKGPTAAVLWADARLQEIRRRDGGSLCVLSAQIPSKEVQGFSPSFWVEQRQLRHLTALREMPVCRAPFPESDSHFPALDWPRWIARRFVAKVPQLWSWWREQLSLCRAVGMPVCNAPERPASAVPFALDVLFSKQLMQDSQLRWASRSSRPDLGETSLMLVDAQDASMDSMARILEGNDITAGCGGGQVNVPGVYRSICLEVSFRTKLCICALQHARYLSDMEGGELSKKLIRKVGGGGDSAARNVDHTSDVSVTNLESLVTMVQRIADVRATKAKEIASLRQRWASQSDISVADIPADDDAQFVATMKEGGSENAALCGRLEELRAEHNAQSRLLDGLYGWLASPTSMFFDAALLKRVQQYMDRVLQLFVSVLKRNGCSVIFASYSRVLFATGKLRVLPDIRHFWESFCENVKSVKALEPLALSDVSCLSELFYGVIWMDPANWAGVPIDPASGSVVWKARSCWKIADFLPAAVRPGLTLYACEMLVGPQQELEARYVRSALSADGGVDVEMPGEEMVDGAAGMDGDGESDDEIAGKAEEDGNADAPAPAADGAVNTGKVAEGGPEAAASNADLATRTAAILEELQSFIKGDFYSDLRLRVLRYVEGLQEQHQRDLPGGSHANESSTLDDVGSESSGDDEDGHEASQRKAERIRRHLEQKWAFPDSPGRRSPPSSVDVEFMKALIQVFQLDESLADEVVALRDRLCQKLKVSSFGSKIGFHSPCFPLYLRDLACPKCSMVSHVDVTSHPSRGPGLWVCSSCNQLYDRDAMQALLVEMLESIVQAWQTQEVVCQKCKRVRIAKLQHFCECFGRFQPRLNAEDFRLVLRVLRSLVGPHDLTWLGEVLSQYEHLL